jgi:hypothetical protein
LLNPGLDEDILVDACADDCPAREPFFQASERLVADVDDSHRVTGMVEP